MEASATSDATSTSTSTSAAPAPASTSSARPALPAGIEERFFGDGTTLEPYLHAVAKAHYVDAKAGVDQWEEIDVLAPLVDDDKLVDWSQVVPAANRNGGFSVAWNAYPRASAVISRMLGKSGCGTASPDTGSRPSHVAAAAVSGSSAAGA